MALLAGTLAPIHRAGFECRLERDDEQVDLQQGVRCRDGEPQALADFIAARLGGVDSRQKQSWQALAEVCRAYGEPGSPLAEALSELWLEFDVPSVSADGTAGFDLSRISPSVFARVRPGPRVAQNAAVVFALLTKPREMRELERHLLRCTRACADGAYVSHIALMLGREPAALRLNVSGLSLRLLPSYLEAIGWPGPAAEMTRLSARLLEFVDSIVFALDIGAQVEPRLGLECFFSEWHALDPRWEYLLEYLVDSGLCADPKRKALLSWPGRVSPADAPGPWPEQLLISGLLQPPDRFGVLDRRLSHVKVVHTPGSPLRAKAYFGFEPIWLTPAGKPHRETEETAGGPASAPTLKRTRRTALPAKASLTRAIRLATAFLLDARNQAGMWRDFYARARPGVASRFMAATSDEWVTAYVGWALAMGTTRTSREAAREAWTVLSARRTAQDGWGYNAQFPADADSTAWALRLAQALGIADTERMRNARAFLLSHQHPGGGIACYHPEDSPALSRALHQQGPFDGWCTPHVSITAAAATLALGPGPVAFLTGRQRSDGSWADYWWDDDEVATARAVEALLSDGQGESREAGCRGVRWAAARIRSGIDPDSPNESRMTPFAVALCVETLARGFLYQPVRSPLYQGLQHLLTRQRQDGSFEPSAWMRAPAPRAMTIEQSAADALRTPDHDAIYTTATALAALHTVYSLGSGVFASE